MSASTERPSRLAVAQARCWGERRPRYQVPQERSVCCSPQS